MKTRRTGWRRAKKVYRIYSKARFTAFILCAAVSLFFAGGYALSSGSVNGMDVPEYE